jgi:hypothetical protein
VTITVPPISAARMKGLSNVRRSATIGTAADVVLDFFSAMLSLVDTLLATLAVDDDLLLFTGVVVVLSL